VTSATGIASSAHPSADRVFEPVQPLRELLRRGEDQRCQSQLAALARSGVLPAAEDKEVVHVDLVATSSSGSAAKSSTALKIQRAREKKIAQAAADRKAAASAHAAEDASATVVVHCAEEANPFSALLGDLCVVGVFVQRFDQLRLFPAAWFFKGSEGGSPPLLRLNGRSLEKGQLSAQKGLELVDGDVLQVTSFLFLLVRIPRKARSSSVAAAEGLSLFEQAVLTSQDPQLKEEVFMDYLHEKRLAAHLDVQRELNAIRKHKEKSRLMSLKTFAPLPAEVAALVEDLSPLVRTQIGLTLLATHYMTLLAFRLRRPLLFKCVVKPDLPLCTQSEVGRDEAKASAWLRRMSSVEEVLRVWAQELDEPRLELSEAEVEVATGTGTRRSARGGLDTRSSWMWPRARFLHRLFCAADMLTSFVDPAQCDGDLTALSTLFPPSCDPLQDALQDELVGVAFLAVDPLLSLLDIDDCVKIVNFNGDATGYLKVAVRSWIDDVEPVPPYLTVDKEVSLRQWREHRLVSRFHFEFLSGLPAGHCADCFVYFRFMKQFPAYLTPRCVGRNERPVIEHTVQVEELIDEDLLRFLAAGCVEFEVFARKRPALQQRPPSSSSSTAERVGEALYAELLGDLHDEDVLAAARLEHEREKERERALALQAGPALARAQMEQLAKQLVTAKAELQNKKKQLKMTSKLADSLKAGYEAEERKRAAALNALQIEVEKLRRDNQALERNLTVAETNLKAAAAAAAASKNQKSKACVVQ
jgi:hypothetical protein